MEVLQPHTLKEALEIKSARPDAMPIAGGTDVMVGVNFGRLRPAVMIDVSRVPELKAVGRYDGRVFLGAGVTYARIAGELSDLRPLVEASRSVGSPQIRERGTVGGNLGTASPAGDALPVLAAYDADVEVASAARGSRRMSWREFLVGPKRTALAGDELIVGAHWAAPRGNGTFSKVGTRNAMVIAVIGLCLVLDEDGRRVRVALGSVGPTILRAPEAEEFAASALAESGVWQDPTALLPDSAYDEFARRVAATARPIDDIRGTASYRRHACGVLARRALAWALDDRRAPGKA
ncbi:MAG: FAD binding domain-containing protein [Candidatus Dormibacterales bacterium]